MHRIDGAGATDQNLFTEGSPASGVPATTVTEEWLNDVQEEVCNIVEAAGLTLEKGTRTQLLEAISHLSGRVVANKAELVALLDALQAAGTLEAANGRKVFVASDDGGAGTMKTGAAGTYSSNGGDYCGTQAIPTGGDGSFAWERDWDKQTAFINWWGATGGDAAIDNVAAIESAAAALGKGVLTARPGRYYLHSTAEIPYGVWIEGPSGGRTATIPAVAGEFDDVLAFSPVSAASGGSYTESFLFFLNIARSSPSTWVEPYPGIGSGGARQIVIYNDSGETINGLKFAGSHTFEDIVDYNVATLIEKPNVYTDNVAIRRIHGAQRFDDTSWHIYLPGNGDGLVIEQVANGYTGVEVGITYGVYVGQVRGAKVSTIINGINKFVNASGEVYECQLPGGQIIVQDGNMDVHHNHFNGEVDVSHGTDGDIVPIVFTAVGDAYGNRFISSARHNTFYLADNARSGWPTTARADIQVDGSYTLTLENNVRNITLSGSLAKSQVMAARIHKQDDTVLEEYDDYAHVLATKKFTISHQTVEFEHGVTPLKVAFSGITGVTSDYTDWDEATGTYYYQAQLLLDRERLIGRDATGAEVSLALTNGGDVPELSINWSTIDHHEGYMIRLYRGTSTGSYDAYVDVPIVAVKLMYDNGDCVNSFPWQARSAAGVDTLNDAGHAYSGIHLIGENAVFPASVSNVLPTVGTWNRGDRILYAASTAPSVGSNALVEFRRLTSGANHVDGTDWIKLQMIRG